MNTNPKGNNVNKLGRKLVAVAALSVGLTVGGAAAAEALPQPKKGHACPRVDRDATFGGWYTYTFAYDGGSFCAYHKAFVMPLAGSLDEGFIYRNKR